MSNLQTIKKKWLRGGKKACFEKKIDTKAKGSSSIGALVQMTPAA